MLGQLQKKGMSFVSQERKQIHCYTLEGFLNDIKTEKQSTWIAILILSKSQLQA